MQLITSLKRNLKTHKFQCSDRNVYDLIRSKKIGIQKNNHKKVGRNRSEMDLATLKRDRESNEIWLIPKKTMASGSRDPRENERAMVASFLLPCRWIAVLLVHNQGFVSVPFIYRSHWKVWACHTWWRGPIASPERMVWPIKLVLLLGNTSHLLISWYRKVYTKINVPLRTNK